ncbi:hypothetical protein RUM44_000560 [Polyplax serrata]|uniref:Major facilitator superfamily associated domain-containing protein n=1 Tax=Polyplax serrata TaxID=468196 RepID=A0ABR1B5X5_POLSC
MALNRRLLPVKAHFFLFMAVSGPILPYLTVYGKQLGISEVVMGTITAVVPLTFLLAKPVFGFIADYFYEKRKFIFMSLIMSMSLFYLGLYFVPPLNIEVDYSFLENNHSRINFCDNSQPVSADTSNASAWPIQVCNVTCHNETTLHSCPILGLNYGQTFCYEKNLPDICNWTDIPQDCHRKCLKEISQNSQLFQSTQFYIFIILMTLSMITFNVSNSISDAICFDVLGENGENNYGYQRVWGTIGFGITAFLGGLGMDFWSDGEVKNYNPAFFMIIVFTLLDMICCVKLKVPKFLEDLAIGTDQMKHIKVLEGLTVAAETLGGEIIFFLLSGKILKTLGYGHTLTLCFFNYALRLCLISFISDPWWIVAIELLMQGPTYALCYTTIVAYANAISPPGTSATMQGIIAGMDDGFGYSLGSLLGGFLYKNIGGRLTFQLFSVLAVLCCITHMILYKTVLSQSYNKGNVKERKTPGEELKMMATVPG